MVTSGVAAVAAIPSPRPRAAARPRPARWQPPRLAGWRPHSLAVQVAQCSDTPSETFALWQRMLEQAGER